MRNLLGTLDETPLQGIPHKAHIWISGSSYHQQWPRDQPHATLSNEESTFIPIILLNLPNNPMGGSFGPR